MNADRRAHKKSLRTGEVAGGARGPIEARISYETTMPVHQLDADSLASRPHELKSLIGEAARKLRPLAHTAHDQRICDDAARGLRLSFDGLETLVRLAARSETPFVLEESIRTAVIGQITNAAPCPDEVNEAETEANHPLNHAQLLWERERTPIRALQVVETGRQQLWATRLLIDVFTIRAFRRSA